jgi:type IV secretion system protein VirB6
MNVACPTALDAGVVKGVLAAVDCRTRDFAELGYQSLTGAPLFQTALTLLLTIYVAVLGYRLLFATEGARLSEAPGVALRIGVVLMLVASWATFQTLVFDVAAKAPLEIAGLAAAPLQAQGSHLAANPVDGLQAAYDQLNIEAAAFGKVAPAVAKSFTSGEAAAGQALSDAAGALFATTAGLVSVAAIALGVLTAVGPVFVTLFLFRQTRGLFEGWVRAMIAAALAPMGAWVLIVLMLTVLEPWLEALAQQRAQGLLDVRGAMTAAAIVFVFCAAQVALVTGACVIAMGFRWRARAATQAPAATAAPQAVAEPAPSSFETLSRAQRLAVAVRQLDQTTTGLEVRRTSLVRQAAGAQPAFAMDAAPPQRLGDSYRRPQPRPRARMGSGR